MCQSKYVEVVCKDCSKQFSKRKDSIKEWEGNCFSCARRIVANLPHVKARTRESCSGHKSHFWRGGVTSLNMKIRCSAEYRQFRRKIMERDNFTCHFCKQRGGKLNVDHIKPFCDYPELRFVESNCRTLGVPCHRTTPTWGRNSYSKLGKGSRPRTNWEPVI